MGSPSCFGHGVIESSNERFFVSALWHWLLNVTGTHASGSGEWYNFWSGFGSDFGEVAILGGLITVVRHQNCTVKGCYRLGRHEYEMDGVKHKLCRVHHPAIDQHHHVTGEEIQAHFAAKN